MGGEGGLSRFRAVAPGFPRSMPLAYVWPDGLDSWRQIQLLKNKPVFNLINSTQLQFILG